MTTFYFIRDGKSVGPFDKSQIVTLYDAGMINSNTLIWASTDSDWLNFASRFNAASPPPLPGSRLEPRLGREVDPAPWAPRIQRNSEPVNINSPTDKEYQSPNGSSSNGWKDQKPHPWRRYIARILDNTIGGGLMWFMLSMLIFVADPEFHQRMFSVFDKPGGQILDIVATTVLAVIPNGFIIGLTGGNFGKWLMGVKVVRPNGEPLGITRATLREIQLLSSGLAFGVPVFSLITLISSYSYLKANGATRYDKWQGNIVFHRKPGTLQYLGYTLSLLLLLGGFILLALLRSVG